MTTRPHLVRRAITTISLGSAGLHEQILLTCSLLDSRSSIWALMLAIVLDAIRLELFLPNLDGCC